MRESGSKDLACNPQERLRHLRETGRRTKDRGAVTLLSRH